MYYIVFETIRQAFWKKRYKFRRYCKNPGRHRSNRPLSMV